MNSKISLTTLVYEPPTFSVKLRIMTSPPFIAFIVVEPALGLPGDLRGAKVAPATAIRAPFRSIFQLNVLTAILSSCYLFRA
jgi:hypothetical protein